MIDNPILCPDCGHDINLHVFEFDFERYFCGGTYGDCECRLGPSDIARALLTAEPTEAEVEAMADFLYPRPFLFVMHGQTPEEAASARLDHARAALQAAREARA